MSATASASLRILVVDDNDAAADTISRLITLWGHEARIATDGRAGFEEACDFHPDVIVMDIGLPQLNGFVAARLVRTALGQAVTMIALTAFSSHAFRAEARQAGFDYYLTKPAGLSDLQRIVSEVVGKKGQTQRPPEIG
jgi:two-component system CheB/CheR fusion protein